jgi:hypothetical protein
MDYILGVSLTGVPFSTAASIDNTDPFYPNPYNGLVDAVATKRKVDICGGDINPWTKAYHYHTASACIVNSTIQGNTACSASTRCDTQHAKHMMDGWVQNKSLTAIGIAKDGHVIYGPYKDATDEWACLPDVCNGVVLSSTDTSDLHYAYAASKYFPYLPACLGRGNKPTFYPKCT